MEFFLILIVALILLKPEDVQQLARGLGKLWRTKNEWKIRAGHWLNSLGE